MTKMRTMTALAVAALALSVTACSSTGIVHVLNAVLLPGS